MTIIRSVGILERIHGCTAFQAKKITIQKELGKNTMSNLVVVTFDNAEDAGKVREALSQLEKQNLLSLDDSAVVVKDAEGKIHVHNQVDRGIKIGAIGGGLLGLMLGIVFFPLAGLAIGVAGGALVGKMVDLGVDQKFVKQLESEMTPGSSAIFVLVRQSDPNAVLAALKPYSGHVYQTSLDTEAEESLRRVLDDSK
jgi:uncharacterized membrane protein